MVYVFSINVQVSVGYTCTLHVYPTLTCTFIQVVISMYIEALLQCYMNFYFALTGVFGPLSAYKIKLHVGLQNTYLKRITYVHVFLLFLVSYVYMEDLKSTE